MSTKITKKLDDTISFEKIWSISILMALPAYVYWGYKIYSIKIWHVPNAHFSVGSCSYATHYLPFFVLFMGHAFPMMDMRNIGY